MQLLEFNTAELRVNDSVQNLEELFRAQVTATERHAYKRWVLAVVQEAMNADDLKHFAEANGLRGKPFVVGARGPETLVVYQAPECDKHRLKALVTDSPVELLTFRRTGNQSQRVVSLFKAIFDMCSVVYTNCAFADPRASAAAPEHDGVLDYEGTLSAVLGMRLDKFEALFGDAKLKKSRKLPISDLEHNVLTCFSTLHPIVKLREDSEALLYDLNSDKFTRAAPLPLAEGASEYALRHMPVTLWVRGAFRRVTLTEWLDDYCESHSLFLVGRAGAGKSKLLHMVAAELCLGKECDPPCRRYVWAKALDPLGVLSHTGVLASAGCLVLTDLTLTTGRNQRISSEELKSLLDVVEGGVVQSCRYRSATISAGLPRVMAVNMGDSTESFGRVFSEHGQHGLAELLNNLEDLTKATRLVQRLSDDDVATARRVAICTPDPKESLITARMLEVLEADTARFSGGRKARRAAFWATRG
jgi:hypothetical protein